MSNEFRRFVVLSLQYNRWPEVQNKLVHICFHEFQDANDIYDIDDMVKIRMMMVMTIKLMMMKMARLMIRTAMMMVDDDDDDK